MTKVFITTLFIISFSFIQAQEVSNNKTKKKYKGRTIPSRDHIMIQMGYNYWLNQPDSVNTLTKGKVHRTFSFYGLYDFPLNKEGKFSFAAGGGMTFRNVYFNNANVDIIDEAGKNNQIVFNNLSDTNRFKRSKLTTILAEFPLELRYSSNPKNFSRGVKVAIGIKVGILLNAYTKYSKLENKKGVLLSDHKEKYFSSDFFQRYNFTGTVRIGWGIVTLYADYQLNSIFKENQGPNIQPLTIGLCISGL